MVVKRLNGFKFEKDGKKRLNRTVYRTFPTPIVVNGLALFLLSKWNFETLVGFVLVLRCLLSAS
jgi:hypothetical protein